MCDRIRAHVGQRRRHNREVVRSHQQGTLRKVLVQNVIHSRVNDAAIRPGKAGATNRNPKSMVIRMGAGEVGSSVGQLVKDVRTMMEPDTASRLKVRIVFLHPSSQMNNC